MPDILTGVLGWVTASQINGIDEVTSGITALFTDQTADAAGASTVPRAYINYIFFDEQFQVVKDATGNLLAGYSRVGNKNEFYPIPLSCYLFCNSKRYKFIHQYCFRPVCFRD